MGNSSSTSYTRMIGSSVEEAKAGDCQFWSKVPLFKYLPVALHPQLTECSEKVSFNAQHVLFREGEVGNEFYVIKSGEAFIEVSGSVETLSAGDYCGEGALLGNHSRRATVTAKTTLECLVITREKFESLGLHKKIEFPRREKKVNKRHQMMTRGAAGGNNKDVGASLGREMTYSRAPKTENRPYLKVQCDALMDIFSEKINMPAFIFVPLGQVVAAQGYSSGVVFTANFLAIIPLAHILGEATEALSFHTGQLIGGLLNATFGNAVEMIMCIQAVRAGLVTVVQGNLLGSVLSNLLLVLGMAIFTSGVVRHEQQFNAKGAASNMRCQLVASIGVCLPTVFAAISVAEEDYVLTISRISSGFLMSVYMFFLFFMLKTHNEIFIDEADDEEEEEGLSPLFSTLLLVGCTYVVFIASDCLVDTIEDVSSDYGISKAFIGVILLPIVGNAAEHSTAVTAAYKGMMDLALGVAVGSSTQIALFVVPCAVMFGWAFDQPMDLNFTIFDTTCQMLAVFLVSNVLSQGETNWLDGCMLMTVYALIATQTLFIHNEH